MTDQDEMTAFGIIQVQKASCVPTNCSGENEVKVDGVCIKVEMNCSPGRVIFDTENLTYECEDIFEVKNLFGVASICKAGEVRDVNNKCVKPNDVIDSGDKRDTKARQSPMNLLAFLWKNKKIG